MKKLISLNLSYNKQRLYRNILVALGLVSKDARYSSDNLNVLFTPEQFAEFTARALVDTEAVYSLRSMGFRYFTPEEQPQKEMFSESAQDEQEEDFQGCGNCPACTARRALSELFSAALGVPVQSIDVRPMSQEDFANLLGGNLRESQMDTRPTPTDEELEDMHLRAIEWDAKISNATELAVRHYYQNHGGVSIWAIWRLLEQTGGIPDWHTFRPKSEYKDIAPRILWAQAQQLRANVLDMTV